MNQLDSAPLASAGRAAGRSRPAPVRRSAARSEPAWRFAFVHACWHADIVGRARDAYLAEMARHRIPREAIDVFEVPGAFELPLHALRLARSGRYDAIVASGFVVDGGVYRHDFVAEAVIDGLMRVQLDSGVPVISAVLTPHHFHEHEVHREFFCQHFVVKGTEAASACVQTVLSLQRIAA